MGPGEGAPGVGLDWLREKGVSPIVEALPVGWWPGRGPFEGMPPWPGLVFPYSPWAWGVKALMVRRVPKKEFVFYNPQGGWPGLFGLAQAQRGLGEVSLVEGETDALALGAHYAERWGVWPNVVALGGSMGRAKALSALRSAGYRTVLLFPDNDEPGLRLAEELARSARAEGVNLVVLWPEGYLPGEDPGGMVARLGPGETLRRAWAGRLKPYQFIARRIVELGGGGPDGELWAREEAVRFARDAELGPGELHDFVLGLADATGLPPDVLRAELVHRGGLRLRRVELLPMAQLAREVARPPEGLPWPWEALNRVLGPLVPGHLYLVAGAPGSGKTTLLCQLADSLASAGFPVLYLSLEEGPRSLVMRTLARELDIPLPRLLGEDLTPHVRELEAKSPRMLSLRFVVSGSEALTPGFVERELAEPLSWVMGRPPVVIVDYLQRLPRRADPRVAVAENVLALKAMALRLGTPVVAASSVPKTKYEGMDLSAFKEAGEAEFTADCALGLLLSGSELRVHVLKNRFGRADPTGSLWVSLRFLGDRARVE